MNKSVSALVLLGLLSASPSIQAQLVDRGGGLIYDDVLNVTWLQDANYARTIGYNADGRMTWDEADQWTYSLVYHDPIRNIDYDDWRLPKVIDTGEPGCVSATPSGSDCPFNILAYDPVTGIVYNELAYMYYDNLGLKGGNGSGPNESGVFGNGTYNGTDHSSYGQKNLFPFVNVQNWDYWTGLTYSVDDTKAWDFVIFAGGQDISDKTNRLYNVWPVRNGDVLAVPEPSRFALVLVGVVGVIVAARFRVSSNTNKSVS